ncbi:MAG: hypothetical protein AB7P99_10165 [Vicinamibacterales bacterium]
MADVDLFGNPIHPGVYVPPELPPTAPPSGGAGPSAPSPPLDVEGMIARDTGAWRGMLQQATHGLNFGDPTKAVEEELPGVLNWVRANVGADPRGGVDEAIARLKRRGAAVPGGATNTPGGGSPTPPSGPTGPTTGPSNQFNDPYTAFLEDIAKRNIASLQGQNAEMQRLMGFLNTQFEKMANSDGFTPEELAMLRTQALEPINAQRDTAQQRVLERAGLRGILPGSGVVQSEAANTDRAFAAMQGAAQRDIGLQNINRRDQNLQNALNLGQLAVALPDQRNAQALNIAQMLYQVPRNALQDALMVVNSANPSAAIGPMISLFGQQQNQANWNTANSQQNQAALWQLLGQIFGSL